MRIQKILEMSHNCALTSRHWKDNQILKRELGDRENNGAQFKRPKETIIKC